MSTFVSVGNAKQPFTRMLDEVARIAHRLPKPIVVQHGVAAFESDECASIQFLRMDEFENLICVSDLLIIHGGAGSVIHALRAGKVPVVVPRRVEFHEHIDNHQVEFASELLKIGRVIVVNEILNLEDAAKEALNRQRNAITLAGESTMLRLVDATLESYAKKFSR